MSMLVGQNWMKWFQDMPRGSAGQMLMLVWSLGAMLLAFAYDGNLRASLIAVEYEKPIDSHVVGTVYQSTITFFHWKLS